MSWAAALALGLAWTAVGVLLGPAPTPELVKAVGWVLLEGSPLRLETGRRYRGCVRVSWPLSTLVSASALRTRAIAEGFRESDLVIEEQRPAAFPEVRCDYYVEGTWTKAARTLDRPGQIPLAWREGTS